MPFLHSINDSPKQFSNKELYAKCKLYGEHARFYMRKFAALLPEVFRRHLYKKYGCTSIHEFAAKLAGLNYATVNKILRLSENLKDTPVLQQQFESGKYGWSKIEKVASIATAETDQQWAEKVATLSTRALEVYVQEVRKQNFSNTPLQNNVSNRSVNSHVREFIRETEDSKNGIYTKTKMPVAFRLDENTKIRLEQFKHKLEKKLKEPLDWNTTLQALLDNAERKKTALEISFIFKRKKSTTEMCKNCAKNRVLEKEYNQQKYEIPISRNIPAAVRQILQAKYNNLCAFPKCNKPMDIYHHTQRFALTRSHNPDFIVPLCKAHEWVFHAGLVEGEEKRPPEWKIRAWPNCNEAYSAHKLKIDERVTAHYVGTS